MGTTMRTKDALLRIVDDARGWLEAWSAGFTDAEARDPKGSFANPLAWQLGHVACGQDDVVRLFGDGTRDLPASLVAICASGCPAPTAATKFPPLAELWKHLRRTHARLKSLIESAAESDLDRPPREPSDTFSSLGQAALEISLHEAYHVGSISTLRRAHAKPPIA